MNAFRGIYRIWATILTAAVVLQIFFAGYGAFDTADKVVEDGTVDENSFEDSFGLHIGFGYLIFLGTLVFLLISFGTRDRRRIYRALGVVGLLDPADPAGLDRLWRSVRLRRTAPDERVRHPRLPRLDHVSRVEGSRSDAPRPRRRPRHRPPSYSGSLCADLPAR